LFFIGFYDFYFEEGGWKFFEEGGRTKEEGE
jgi:hypothetical protein